MNKMTILPVMVYLLAGCAGPNTLAFYGCEIERPDRNCSVSNSPANPALKFNKNGLVMTPNNVCTQAGAEVEIEIKPVGSSAPGTIVVVAKNPLNSIWLLGTNSDDPDKISITIPETVPDGKYDYLIVDTANGTCLDPRWEVE
ncbi:MAG: hypothetical protein V2I25_03210 [Woeseiaceae bacterium]|jgi:hypothetical protein|nr:hypothetical protein [Woeseiaceae bacterium]